MPRRFFVLLMGCAGLSLLVVVIGRFPGVLTALLLCGACALLGASVLLLAPPPWPTERHRWRVRYHAPEAAALDSHRLGAGLHALARLGEWVDVVWRRQAGEITLELELGPVSATLLDGLIAQLLPEGTLEPLTDTPPYLPAGRCGWWPLQSGATAPPLLGDPAPLLDETLFVGDLEYRLHLAADGAAVLVAGTPTALAYRRGCRRWPLPRACGAWLLRHYRLWETWPDGDLTALYFPATGGAGTRRLDLHQGMVVPPPSDYCLPEGNGPLLGLGRATANGQLIGVRAEAGVGTLWGGHFLALGAADATAATVSAVVESARSEGVGVIHFHPHARSTRIEEGARLAGVDLDHPGISWHWNLLAVAPRDPGPAAELRALHTALLDRVPLLGACLIQWGLLAPSNGAGWALLLDGARALLCAHYRRRLDGTLGTDDGPNLPTLVALLTDPAALPALVEREIAAWEAADLADVLSATGLAGAASAELVRTTLAGMTTRLLTLRAAERRQHAAELTDRLAPMLETPYLRPWWAAPQAALGLLLNDAPPLDLDIYLPLGDPGEPQAVAVRRYGFYLLACLIGVAQERLAAGQTAPPLLLVLTEGAGWWAGSLLRTYAALLAQAGMAALTTCSQLPTGPAGAALLDAMATWWVHSLVPADATRVVHRLHTWGVHADLPLTRLPPGIAVLKTGDDQGHPLVATVDTRDVPSPDAAV